MYRIIPCTQDSYITNKIINFRTRATDANVGSASTLDLFKLFDETLLSGTVEPIELSRLLVKFDTSRLQSLTSSIDINSSTFKAYLSLTDVYGGQPTPTNFNVVIHPLSKSWDEGIGRDVTKFSDIDVTNWITASVSDGFLPWSQAGAAAEGDLGSTDIDIIGSGNLADELGFRQLFKTQIFTTGDENLYVDVTDIVSATIIGAIPDHGFRIAYSSSFEQNSNSYFVKRFATRHSTNPMIRPKLIITFDDSIIDNHDNFTFNTSGSLYIFNNVRGNLTNFVSGAAATQITGSSCMQLKLISGAIAPEISQSFSTSFNVSQFTRGMMPVSGVYFANFAVSSFDQNLIYEVNTAGSATFSTVWGSLDGTVAYLTSSLIIKIPDISNTSVNNSQLNITLPNFRQTYSLHSQPRIRVNIYDKLFQQQQRATKIPIQQKQLIFETVYWRVVDVYTGEIIIPFGNNDNSTRLSTDASGMYFDFFPVDLYIGRIFTFEFMIHTQGEIIIVDSNLPTFMIEP